MFSTFRTAALAAVVTIPFFGMSYAAVTTYDFTGTLGAPFNGETGVSGSFTVDNVADTITGFSFTSPFGSATPSNHTAKISQYLPAMQPTADFTQFQFLSDNLVTIPAISLLFQSSLANFGGGSLYTAGIIESGGSGTNSLMADLSLVDFFASGMASPVTTAPEPASLR
jgi:hypothetical protein